MSEIIIQNPITDKVLFSIKNSKNRLKFAVPFITSFALRLLSQDITKGINDKKIIARFDDSTITSFDIPSLKKLLDLGFEIRYDNKIHLKLYITDSDVYVSSSNLTTAGFEKNKELTVKLDSINNEQSVQVFDSIWEDCEVNKISYELLDANIEKYDLLKKKEKHSKRKDTAIIIESNLDGHINIAQIIEEIFSQNKDYSNIRDLSFKANASRQNIITQITQDYDKLIFYAPEGHKNRRVNLFYEFVYGAENHLAGTGLREQQFKDVFEHPKFKDIINFMLPEIVSTTPWNLSNQEEFLQFCNGIFDFEIPQYSEALPIRLASYFYPQHFLPIFKLSHLQQTSEAFGLETNAVSKGERLFTYNKFLLDKMAVIPENNYVKSNISYQILYTVELNNRLLNGESYEAILKIHKELWKKEMIKNGRQILLKIKEE